MFKTPEVESDLFDREKIRQLFKKRLLSLKEGFKQNIAIIGPEKIGKTSLIRNFMQEAAKEDCLPIYIALREEPFAHFANRFMGCVLYHLLKSKGLNPKENAKSLIKRSKKIIPNTIDSMKKIRKLILQGKFDESFQNLFDLPEILRSETDRFIIVILDEFHHLNGLGIGEPFVELGKKIMIQKNIMHCIASSRINFSKNVLSEKLRLLFGNFEMVKLEGFNYSTCVNFIEEKLENIKISERIKGFLATFTEGRPYYLSVILKSINNIILKEKQEKVTIQILCKALEETLFDSSGALYYYFLKNLEMLPEDKSHFRYRAILLTVADNNNKLNLISRIVKRDKKEVSKMISQLIEMDILQKNGIFIRFSDKLFKFWLKFVYKPRLSMLDAQFNAAKENFIGYLEKRIDEFTKESKKDLYERVTELFKCFRNEIIEIENKSFRLPNFSTVEPKMIQNRGPYIFASNNKQNWLCQIRQKHVSENDLADLLEAAKFSTKNLTQRKVLVTLNGLENGAKLLTKEKGILTLNLNSLNILTDVFGKEQFIK